MDAAPVTESSTDVAELGRALAGASIETRYQPIVQIQDRRPVALEVLVRLNDPVRGILAPDAFVPQIEDAGLAARLTSQVTERAFADTTGPLLRSYGFDIMLNVPLDVLLDADARQRLDETRHAAGVGTERIIVELTESRPVEHFAALGAVLETLRVSGYRVFVDDISPTVPNCAALLQLPFTGMKLDRQLVQSVPTSPESRVFASDVIALAKKRNLTVTAEGVEDVPTWHRMAALGVDQAQGFLLARPLPAAVVPNWLKAWQNQPAFG